MKNEILETINDQKKYGQFLANADYRVRINALKRLKEVILKYRDEIKSAVFSDFKKPFNETELTEIHTSLDEINVAIKNVKKWMKPKRVSTPITLFGASSFIQKKPKGMVLIISPWNYPFSMAVHPLIAAIAAGNTAIIKPSEKSAHVSTLLKKMINEVFEAKEIEVFLGDATVTQALLDFKFDHIIFTGNSNVGKIIMNRASEHLTPVTLELGGKSPVIIDKSADLKDAAKKLSWGKFVNAGQTCIAPDHVFIHKDLKNEFISLFRKEITLKFGIDPKESNSFARIIDDAAFERLKNHLKPYGLDHLAIKEERYIPPTILDNVTIDSMIMSEEIFGPILPVLEYENIDEVIDHINSNPRPLALYLFSKNNKNIDYVLTNTISGGSAINHVLLHAANSNMPFGGVGNSGMGNYHGEFGFRTFSHERSVLKQGVFTLTSLYFQPYAGKLSDMAYKLIRIFE